MNDVHVESLSYRLSVLDERHDYSGASAWRGRLGDFEVHLEGATLIGTPKTHFSSAEGARAALEPILRSWELRADLEDSIPIRFSFETARVMDRQPNPGGTVVQINLASEVSLAGEVSLRVGHASFPPPARAPLAEDTLVKDHLTSIHDVRMRTQRLLVGAYLFLSRLEYEFGGSRQAAAKGAAVSERVLNKLGELSVVNDADERRKVQGPARPLMETERNWLDKALRRITLQVAQLAAAGTPPQLTMTDLPAL